MAQQMDQHKADNMKMVLTDHNDFMHEKTDAEHCVESCMYDCGHVAMFLHYQLNPDWNVYEDSLSTIAEHKYAN